MKASFRSINFKLALLSLVLFVVHLVMLGRYTANLLLDGRTLNAIYIYLPLLWVSLAGLLYFRATKLKQNTVNQVLAFLMTPFILSPVIAMLYSAVFLAPLYGLVGQSVIK